jgi:hypothetical protein
MKGKQPIFPIWVDDVTRVIAILFAGGLLFSVALTLYTTSPMNTAVGYMPTQPIPYSHKLHVGELGLDCRYCHTGVETGAKANIPPTQTCMNCHNTIFTESHLLEPLRDSYKSGKAVEWIRVHDLPDFVFFNHSIHVNKGIGCVSCHGRVDKMETVYQAKPLNMGWCLDCHRNPTPNIRPLNKVTDLRPIEEILGLTNHADLADACSKLAGEYQVNPKVNCSTCHR